MNRSFRNGRVRRPSLVPAAVAVLAALAILCCGTTNLVEAAVIGHWAFEDDFTDSSANGNDLSVAEGSPTFDATVPPGGFSTKSVSFDTSDGNDRLANGAPTGLDFTSAYSFAGWVERPSTSGYGGIFWRGVSGSSSDIEVYTQPGSNRITVAHNRGNGGAFSYVYYPTIPSGMFHLGVTYDPSAPERVKVYYDGVAQSAVGGTTSLTAPLATTGHEISVGKLNAAPSQSWQANSYYNGLLDELFVFNKTLTETQVNALMRTNDERTLFTGILYDGEATGPVGRTGDKLIDDGLQDAVFHGAGVSVDTAAANARLGDGSFHFNSYGTSGFSTIELPDSSELGTQFTLAAFINPTENRNTRLFSAYDGGSVSDVEFIFDFDPSGANPWTKGLRAYVNGVAITPDSPISFSTGQYHHLAMTYDDGLVSTYVDGVLMASGTAGSGMVSLFENLHFGEDSYGGANEQFAGNADEILLLYDALPAEMIAALAEESYRTLVPEPSSLMLLMLGLVGLAWRRRR